MVDPLEKTLGKAVPNWNGVELPRRELLGKSCRVTPIQLPDDAAELHALFADDPDQNLWNYLNYGPFKDAAAYLEWIAGQQSNPTQLFYVVRDLKGNALGVAAYLRLDPVNGSVEVGHICFSSSIQRSIIATEAMHLMMREAFELGYRRYEWKCHSLNRRSVAAALRYGFQFEGVFRQAGVSKGRNRDTAWFSILDSEWPAVKQAFETWLTDDNFDQAGRQLASLASLTKRPQPAVEVPFGEANHG